MVIGRRWLVCPGKRVVLVARIQLVGLVSTVLDVRNCLVEKEGQEGVDTMQEPSRVVELSSKLVQERLDLEQQLEDMQATRPRWRKCPAE